MTFADDFVTIHHGDCLTVMAEMDADSVDAIVTDPPYGLSFMGRDWDHGVPGEAFWREALRVAKPGAHLVAFGGTRTFHRLTCAIEDAGWEVRDCLGWLYGSGFPKSLNIGDGWGTALKPAWEPIILARKPLSGTVAANVQQHGTGALNVNGTRIATDDPHGGGAKASSGFVDGYEGDGYTPGSPLGRWPANIVHDGSDEVLAVFPQTESGKAEIGMGGNGESLFMPGSTVASCYADKGSAARFFACFPGDDRCSDRRPAHLYGGAEEGRCCAKHTPQDSDLTRFRYCAKADKRERDEGLYGFEEQRCSDRQSTDGVGGDNPRNRTNNARRNFHPTVKPLDLMRWLVRLVTPPDGIVLDPFMGSGTTLKAARAEGHTSIGIDLEREHCEIAWGRLSQGVLL